MLARVNSGGPFQFWACCQNTLVESAARRSVFIDLSLPRKTVGQACCGYCTVLTGLLRSVCPTTLDGAFKFVRPYSNFLVRVHPWEKQQCTRGKNDAIAVMITPDTSLEYRRTLLRVWRATQTALTSCARGHKLHPAVSQPFCSRLLIRVPTPKYSVTRLP